MISLLLFGRSLAAVAGPAEALQVGIVIGTPLSLRLDMVDGHGGYCSAIFKA